MFRIVNQNINTVNFRENNINNINAYQPSTLERIPNKDELNIAHNNFKILYIPVSIKSSLKKEGYLESIQKVDNYLTQKGYETCKDYIISDIVTNFYPNKNIAAGRFLKNFNKIAFSQIAISNNDELEFLVLHEQGHYIHKNLLLKKNKPFKAKKLEESEKQIIKENFREIFKNNNYTTEEMEKALDCYTENNLEFVAYYFTFRHRGVKFNEDVNKIYQKYYGPNID